MSFSTEVLLRAKARLASMREDHASLNAARQAQVYRKVPRIQAIDKQMQQNMLKAAISAFSEGGENAMALAKLQNEQLQSERDVLMAENFEPGYWNDAPFCTTCGGTGYVGSTMCHCLKALCVDEQRKELGAIFTGAESFDSFRLDYYPDAFVPQIGGSYRIIMEKTLKACREYARTFGENSGNLLLNGGTGLGKTHLALAVGKAVGEMGYSVLYETAVSLFAKLEQDKFNSTEETRKAVEKLEKCDLLIVDDLGTEMTGQFTTSALYGLLNTRLMNRKPMVITTNLNVEDAGKRYSPQIASRLYGDFVRLTFVGSDIRILRNRGF